MEPPVGTIALLFTDIEGSTRLAAELGAGWPAVLAEHHALVGGAIAAEGGFVDRTEGDAFIATFADAAAGARAAVAALRGLRAHPWPAQVGELRVRMGLHVGHVERPATGYVGLEIHRAARVASAAHGGQLLMTAAARALTGDVVVTEPVGAHRLKDFPAPEPLFCAVVDGRGAAAFPPPRAHEVRPTNLPAGTPALVGREDDLERVRTALLGEGERLVTLTGRGGAGKTSLALVAAAALLDEHPGGVWLARLAAVASPADVVPAVAAAIGAEQDGSAADAVIGRLRERGPALLVLDNLEHLLPAAPGIAALLDSLPELRVLVTSQAPLRLTVERVLPLDALDDEAALALIERVARRRGATFPAEDGALLDVVHLLDGLPLALELAAARLALLSPAQLRDRLRASSDVLQDAGADRMARHRSLRATLEWTLSLLDAAPRALFTRLGAFAGPVELVELEAVAGADGLDVLDALAGLLDVALVRRVETGDGRVRFGLPEALRQLAGEQLDAAPDGDTWRRAHLQRQKDIAWAARTQNLAAGAEFRAAMAADAEAAAALRWARARDDPLAAPLAAARASMLNFTGRVRETFVLLEPLLARPSGDPVVDGRAMESYGEALFLVERHDEALAAAERALSIAEDPVTRALALLLRGFVRAWTDEPEAGIRDCAQATALARGLDPAFLAGALALEAQIRLNAGEPERAAQLWAEAQRIGAPVDAVALWTAETQEGDLALQSGRPCDALEHYASSLEVAQARGMGDQVRMDLTGVAHALAAAGEDAVALELVGLIEALSAELLGPEGPAVPHFPGFGNELAAAETRLGAAVAAGAKARGRAVPAGLRVTRACELARACARRELPAGARAVDER